VKKALVLFLAVAMVFSFAATAMAFSDIADEKSTTQDAINLFNAQGIINGYPDGTFLPNGTITRAEMAKIVVMYTNNVVLADSLKNVPSEFTDVKTGEWYTGYVNAAVALGYFQGMGDGTFGVSKNLTYGQVVTIALRLAGYNDELPGAWPYDYVAQASKPATPLVKAATAFDAAADATRKDVVLVFNALLGCDMVVYDKETGKFDDTKIGKTVRAELGAMPEGATGDVAITYDAKKGFVLTLTTADGDDEDTDPDVLLNAVALADSFAVSNGYDLVDLITNDYAAAVYTNADGKVCYVDLKGKYVAGFVTATTDATASKLATVTVNGTAYEVNTGATIVDADAEDAALEKGVYAELTLASGKVASAIVTNAVDATGDIVGKLATDGKSFATEDIVADGVADNTLVIKADKKTFIVIKDGAIATVEDIKTGDLVYDITATAALGSAVEKVYAVISPVGEAAVTAITGKASGSETVVDTYVINGVTYAGNLYLKKGAAAFDAMELADYTATTGSIKNKTGMFYTDAKGFALALVYDAVAEVEKTTVVGFVTAATANMEAGSFGAVTTQKGWSDITLLTAAGETVTYAIKDNGLTKNAAIFVAEGDDKNKIVANTSTTNGSGDPITPATALSEGLLVVATLNTDNQVVDLEVLITKSANNVVTNKTYNTIKIGDVTYNLAADIPVLQKYTKSSKLNLKALKAADVVESLNGQNIKYVLNAKNAAKIDYIVVESEFTAVGGTEFIYAVFETQYAEGDKIKFVGNDALYAKADSGIASAAKGDIVKYTVNSEGTIDDLDIVVAMSSIDAAKVADVSGSVVDGKIVDAKAVVYIYNGKADGDNKDATEFVGLGTIADIVKGAYVYAVDQQAKNTEAVGYGLYEIIIVVK